MTKRYIYKIDKNCPIKSEIIGGKASSLVKMSFSNINIPQGFIITIDCFQDYLDTISVEGKFPESVERKILNAYDDIIGNSLVAVRSSATVEDQSQHSYAGKFETVLHVPKNELINAIISVWKSTQLDKDNYIGIKKDIKMGVIIQKMLATEYSGVTFTRYPYEDSPNMNIEIVKGLPNDLVAGKITPTQVLVNRENNSFKEPSNFTSFLIKKIIHWNIEIENKFGKACDIEWGIEKNKLYLLQVRPITSIKTYQSNSIFNSYYGKEKEFDIWTLGNVSEVLPGVMTPLSWSILGENLNELLRKSFRALKKPEQVNSTCFIKLKEGELYYNIGAVNYFTNEIMGFPTMNEVVGGNHINENRVDEITINWFKVMKNIKSVYHSNNTFKNLPNISKQETIKIISKVEKWNEIQLSGLNNANLFFLFDEITNYLKDKMTLHTDATAASFSYKGILQYLINNWLDSSIKSIDLLSNISGVKIVEITTYISDLIEEIKKLCKEKIISKCLSNENWRECLIKEELKEFKEKIENIFVKFGHRGWSEIELSNPTWGMNEEYILKMIISELKRSSEAVSTIKKQNQYEVALNEVNQRLKKNIIKKKIFHHILIEARLFTKLRENNKHALYLIIHKLKLIIKELSSRMYQKGFIFQPDDIYFLTISEVKSLLIGDSKIDLKHLINKRHDQYKIHLQRNQINREMSKTEQSEYADVLKGFTACSGVARGRARILHSIDEIDSLLPGDILIVKTLDVGWTPIFNKIAGLVTEVGGTLSHASIIAREYGLPTVVNVPNVLSTIRDSDLIEVNANKGEVIIIPRDHLDD